MWSKELDTLWDLSHTQAAQLLQRRDLKEILEGLESWLYEFGRGPAAADYEQIAPGVYVERTATVDQRATLIGPTVIGPRTEVRPGAYVRGCVLVGADCVIGNSTELKNCILFDGVQVPHYNYIGDSILGHRAHFGAGALTSNVKGDRSPVVLHLPSGEGQTGRKKVGALVGDQAEIGCHAVLNPGTVIGKNATVYPLCSVRGYVPADHIYKEKGCIDAKKT